MLCMHACHISYAMQTLHATCPAALYNSTCHAACSIDWAHMPCRTLRATAWSAQSVSPASIASAAPLAQSRCRCGSSGGPSPGADVAGVSPVPVQMWHAWSAQSASPASIASAARRRSLRGSRRFRRNAPRRCTRPGPLDPILSPEARSPEPKPKLTPKP